MKELPDLLSSGTHAILRACSSIITTALSFAPGVMMMMVTRQTT